MNNDYVLIDSIDGSGSNEKEINIKFNDYLLLILSFEINFVAGGSQDVVYSAVPVMRWDAYQITTSAIFGNNNHPYGILSYKNNKHYLGYANNTAYKGTTRLYGKVKA